MLIIGINPVEVGMSLGKVLKGDLIFTNSSCEPTERFRQKTVFLR
jgi:hypothetical protein